MTLRTLNYGNYGIFLMMGNAGFCPSTVGPRRSLGIPGRFYLHWITLTLHAVPCMSDYIILNACHVSDDLYFSGIMCMAVKVFSNLPLL